MARQSRLPASCAAPRSPRVLSTRGGANRSHDPSPRHARGQSRSMPTNRRARRKAGKLVQRAGVEPSLSRLKDGAPHRKRNAAKMVGADGIEPPSAGCRPAVMTTLLSARGALARNQTALSRFRKPAPVSAARANGRSGGTCTPVCLLPKQAVCCWLTLRVCGAHEGDRTLLHPLDRRRHSQSATCA